MNRLFWYNIEHTVSTEVIAEDGTKKMEGVKKKFKQCFNLDMVVRGEWVRDDAFAVFLNDGHEQADDVEKPIIKNGKKVGTESKRERSWFISQIILTGEDIDKFMEVS